MTILYVYLNYGTAIVF